MQQAVTIPSSKRKPYMNSFANEWLIKNCFTPPTLFYEIHQGEEKILVYERDIYSLKPDKLGRMVPTALTVGVDLCDQRIVREIQEYKQLFDLGYMIVSIPFTGWFRNQKVAYKLMSKQVNYSDVGKIPDNHMVYWDIYNKRLILLGPNAGPRGQGQWVYMEAHAPKETRRKRKIFDYIKKPFEIEKEYIKRLIPHSPEEFKALFIEEIAVMIDDQGQLICLPKSRDEPTIGIVGQKGKGKSWLLHRLADLAYWKGRRKIGILNDERSECDTWCRAWDADPAHKKFGLGVAKQLALINERPLPLPTVFVHAMNNSLQYITHEQECGIKISFPFDDLISNYERYMKGKEDWELKNSLPYFKNIKNSLLLCRNLDEINETITKMIDPGLRLTQLKLMNLMEDIFNENMLDITNDIPAKMKLKVKDIRQRDKIISEHEYYPFVTFMLADLAPVLETANLKPKGYFPQQFRFIVEDIFNKQSSDPYFKNNKFRIWLFCDEIQSIDSRKKVTAASEILKKVVTEGRPNRTGFIWASQNPEILSDQITTNTPYLFVLGFGKAAQAGAIAKDFDIMKGRESDIKRLQKLEAIACTSEHFIVYDRNGKRRRSDPGESFRGRLLPPLSEHKPPVSEVA